MNHEREGLVFYLDRPNVDTDQIIPAVYLTCVSITGLGAHLFEGVPGLDRTDPIFQAATVLVARENFGCGSSREHAVWALEDHGIRVVIAPSFARIFRQNMYNRGLLAIELPEVTIRFLFDGAFGKCEVDVDAGVLHFSVSGIDSMNVPFSISEFDRTLVQRGGLVGFVAERY